MIPGLSAPAAQFGRSGLLPEGFRHFALSSELVISSGSYARDLSIYAARDNLAFRKSRMRGDASKLGLAGKAGAFLPTCSLVLAGRIYLGGRVLDDGSNSRAILLVADVGPNPIWNIVTTGLEGAPFTGWKGIIGIAERSGQLAVLAGTGEVAVSDDGDDWQAYPNVGFSGGVQSANALAGGPAGFVAVGTNGQAFTAPDARGAWTARTSTFGTQPIQSAVCVGTMFVLSGAGRIASVNGLANFVSRAVPAGLFLDQLMGAPGQFFAGGSSAWLASADGLAWSEPADTPLKGVTTRVRSGYRSGDDWVVHWGDGLVSKSEDGQNWTVIEGHNLPVQPMLVSFAI